MIENLIFVNSILELDTTRKILKVVFKEIMKNNYLIDSYLKLVVDCVKRSNNKVNPSIVTPFEK